MAKGLQSELKQTKGFAILEEEAHLSVVRTAALLEHAFGQALKPYGITGTQYNVLRILRGAGVEGLCRNEVGARLVRAVPDVTRLLDRMKDLRLIGRQRSDEDRRLVRTHITKKGLDLLGEIDGRIAAIHRDRLAHVSHARLKTLIGILAEVRNTA